MFERLRSRVRRVRRVSPQASQGYFLKIRMYNMRLGDCFLLTFASATRPDFHLLIDCGMHQRLGDKADRLKRVVEDIRDTTNGRIDLLVITHEHYDHISGFSAEFPQVRKIWDEEITIDKVWMAWTEGNDDPAPALRRERKAKTERLRAILKATNTTDALELLDFGGNEDLTDDESLAATMDYLKSIARTGTQFHFPGKAPLTIPGLDGIRFYVLGPPATADLLDQEPNAGEAYEEGTPLSLAQTFFTAALPETSDEFALNDYPFATKHRIDLYTTEYRYHESDEVSERMSVEETEEHRKARWFFHERYNAQAERWRQIDNDWLEAAIGLVLEEVEITNNTSLALAIEFIADQPITDPVILFPGDAQAGNWRSWRNHNWTIRGSNGQKDEVSAAALLERTIFYKVGHHGSHNATRSRDGLDSMGNLMVAMIPVEQKFALKQGKKGWKMPFGPLYKVLLKKTGGRVIRADQGWLDHDGKHILFSSTAVADFRKQQQAFTDVEFKAHLEALFAKDDKAEWNTFLNKYGIRTDDDIEWEPRHVLRFRDEVAQFMGAGAERFLQEISLSKTEWERFRGMVQRVPDSSDPLYYEFALSL
jgi:hypothetical protein